MNTTTDNLSPVAGKKKPFSFSTDPEVIDRLRRAAYWERISVSALVEEAVQTYLDALEKKRGKPFEELPARGELPRF